jgi:3-deoxy-D-manno-octulosonic-acid transferase
MSLITARGFSGVRRSRLSAERRQSASRTGASRVNRDVIVVDTVGELAQMYALADVVFVGGSLVPRGGHNVLEPALRRKPVLMGPHTDNFREAAGLLTATGGALVVRDAAALSAELRRLLGDPALAARRGEAAFEALASHHGAVRQTLDLVARFLASDALARSQDNGR